MTESLTLSGAFILSIFILSIASYRFFSRMILNYREDVRRRCHESEILKQDAITSLLKVKENFKDVMDSTESALENARQAGRDFVEKASNEIDAIAHKKMEHAVQRVELVGDNMKREFHKSVLSAAKSLIQNHVLNNNESVTRVVDNTLFESSLQKLDRDKVH